MNTAKKETAANILIDKQDLDFYKRLGVPPPKLSPQQRRMRRLSFRNESSIYRRRCSATGKQIISMYSEDKPFIVYDNDSWWQDDWNAMDYGRNFNFELPFSTQFEKLFLDVPKMARIQQGEQINSQFTNCASYNKNSYLIFSSNKNEDCLYCKCINSSRSCIDCFACNNCELCYDASHCDSCYSCRSIKNSKNCHDCHFIENCIGCNYCFGCINLRNKSYYFFNKALTKEQYLEKISNLNLGSRAIQSRIQEKFDSLSKSFYQPEIYGQQNQNVSGNYLWNCKNSLDCFYCHDLEDCRYCDDVSNLKDSYDVSFYGATGNNELLYECEGVGHNVSNIKFSKLIWGGCYDVEYSYECHACHNIFGCAGLRNSKFCIFNKQYSENKYYELRDKIINHMQITGEWGEFFPIELTPFAYNETVAHEFYPLSKEEAIEHGYKWKENSETLTPSHDIMIDDIAKVQGEVIHKQFCCKTSARLYRIEPSELEFHKKLCIPLPQQHYLERLSARSSRAIIEETREDRCLKCSAKINTSNSKNVICESCFLSILE